MAYNESKRKANDKYDKQNMVAYTVKYQKSIYEAVEKAMADTGMNRNKWTTTAIAEKLERDGYIQSKDNSDQADNADDDKLPWEE